MTAAPATAPRVGFSERIGRAVLFPHKASRALIQGERGGLRDAALLLVPRLLMSETQHLTAQLRELQQGGLRAGFTVLTDAFSALLPDLLGILLGGVLMSLLLGEKERRLRPGLTLDLSAQAWLGWLFLHVLASLAQTLLQRPLGPPWAAVLPRVAIAVWLLYILIGFLTMRRALAEQPTMPKAPPRGGT